MLTLYFNLSRVKHILAESDFTYLRRGNYSSEYTLSSEYIDCRELLKKLKYYEA